MARSGLGEIDLAALAQGLKPYVLPWISAPATGTGGATGGLSAHQLDGAYHSGTLANAQGPQFLLVDGSRPLTGNLGVNGGVTVDGVDISAHAADVNAHHAKVHSITGTDHSLTASQYQVVGATSTNTLGLLTPSADVSGGGTSILRSNAGALELLSLTTPTLQSDATLTITPGTYAILSDDKSLRTTTYTSGFTGSGATYSTASGATLLEVDNAIVRGRLRVYELLIAQIRATNGSVLIANAGKANAVSGSGPYTVTIEPYMVFANGDIIRAQRFTGSGTYVCMGTVSGVSGLNFTLTLSGGSDAPTVGMEFVRLGSTSDASRRGSIYLTADESYAPYIDVLGGIDAASDWGTAGVVRVRLGRLDGITSGTNEYGLWAAGANTGDHLLVSPTSGFELVAGNGVITIDETGGIDVLTTTAADWFRTYSFSNATGEYGGLRGYYESSPAKNYTIVYGTHTGNKGPQVMLWAEGNATYDGAVQLLADGSNNVSVLLTSADGTLAMTGTTSITGTLRVTGAVDFDSTLRVDSTLTVAANGANITGTLTAYNDLITAGPLSISSSTSPTLYVGTSALSTGAAGVKLGYARTGSGYAEVSLIGDATYVDYGLRMIRNNGGANTTSEIIHRGTGAFYVGAYDAADFKLRTNNTLRATVQSTGEFLAEYGVYSNGDNGGIAGYLGLTDVVNTTQGAGTNVVRSTGAGANNNTGFLKMYLGATAIYVPYWTSP